MHSIRTLRSVLAMPVQSSAQEGTTKDRTKRTGRTKPEGREGGPNPPPFPTQTTIGWSGRVKVSAGIGQVAKQIRKTLLPPLCEEGWFEQGWTVWWSIADVLCECSCCYCVALSASLDVIRPFPG